MYKVHAGYMRRLFGTRQEAADYYARHNPHMPPLRLGGGRGDTLVVSEEDPENGKTYVLRPHVGGLLLSVPPFEAGGAASAAAALSEDAVEVLEAIVVFPESLS